MELFLSALTALWIGILVSINPCQLATNIAAISIISQRISNRRVVLLTGIFYTIGRVIAYVLVSLLISHSLIAASKLSLFVEYGVHLALGPILIIVGVLLLELFSFHLPSLGILNKIQLKFQKMGIWAALPLGAVFALSLCPVTATLFFGGLISLAARSNSSLFLPLVFGVGSGLPVLLFAIFISLGGQWMTNFFKRITVWEPKIRKVAGFAFIIVGIYFSLDDIFQVI